MLSELQEDKKEVSIFLINPLDDMTIEHEPLNMERLKKMSEICPDEYLKKIESMLLQYDTEIRKLNKEMKSLRSTNTAMQEVEDENKRII